MKYLCLLIIAFALHIQSIIAQEISLEFQNVHAHNRAFTFYSEQEFIKVGEDGLISKTYDGGNKFEIYWHNNKNELLDIKQTPYGTFICGKGGTILQSTDKGITWKSLPNSWGDFHYIYQVNNYVFFLDSSSNKLNYFDGEADAIKEVNLDEKLFKIKEHNGDYYACAMNGNIHRINLVNDEFITELVFAFEEEQKNYDFEIFQNNLLVLSAPASIFQAPSIKIIDIETSNIIKTMEPDGNIIYEKLFTLDNKHLIIQIVSSYIITNNIYFTNADTVRSFNTEFGYMGFQHGFDLCDTYLIDDSKIYFMVSTSNSIIETDIKFQERKIKKHFTLKPYREVDFYFLGLTGMSDYDSEGNLFTTGLRSRIFKSNDNGNSWDIVFPRFRLEGGVGYSTSETSMYSKSIFNLGSKQYLLIDQGNWVPFSFSVTSEDLGETWAVDTSIGGISYSKKNENEAIIQRKRVSSRPHFTSLYRTQDAGQSWQPLESFPSHIGEFGEISYNNERLLVGLSSRNQLWISYDDGDTFSDSVLYNPEDYPISSRRMKFRNGKGIIYGGSSYLFYTVDNGFSWNSFNLGKVIDCHSGDFIDDFNFVVSAKKDIYKFSFIDTSFVQLGVLDYTKRTITQDWTYEVKAVNDSTLFFMGDDLIKAKVVRDIGSSVEYKTDERISNYFFLSINPGPVNSTAYIKLYGVSMADMNDFQVEVVDMFGSKVMNLTDLAIKHSAGYISEFTADFSKLTQGVYFLKMTSGGSFKTKKFFKVNQ